MVAVALQLLAVPPSWQCGVVPVIDSLPTGLAADSSRPPVMLSRSCTIVQESGSYTLKAQTACMVM